MATGICTVCGEHPCDNPHKRFTVVIKIDAHSWDEAARYIEEFADHVAEHGQTCALISSNRGWIKVIERAEQTQEKYDAELEEWFQARRAEKAARAVIPGSDPFAAIASDEKGGG